MKKTYMKMVILLLTICLIPVLSIYATGKSETDTPFSRVSKLIEKGDYTLPIVKDQMTLSIANQDSLSAVHSLNDNRPIWQEIEKRTNIKIDWQCVYGGKDYTQAINLRVAAAQDLPDIIGTRGQNPIKLYNDKLIVETTDLIKDYAPNILRILKEDRDIQAAMVSTEGKLFVVAPYAQMHNGVTNIGGVFYRLDWVRKLGLKEEPVTLDDYHKMLKAFVEQDPNGNGKQDEVPVIFNALQFFGFFGVHYDLYLDGSSKGWRADKNGKIVYDYLSPRFKEYLKFLNQIYDEKILQKEVVVKSNRRNQYIATNRVGMQPGALSHLANRDKLIAKAGVDLSLGGYVYGGPPLNEVNGKREANPDRKVVSRYMVISSKCKHPEVAVRWLDYVWGSEEGQMLTNFGIKDKTYYIGKDGKPHYTELILNSPKGFNVQDALREFGYQPLVLAYQRPDSFKALWEKNPKIYKMAEKEKAYIKRPLTIPTMMESITDAEDYASIMSDCDTYREEMYLKFIMGAEPINNFDKYVDRMKKLGIERVIEIQQKKYDRLKSFNWD